VETETMTRTKDARRWHTETSRKLAPREQHEFLSPLGNNADYEDEVTSVFEEVHAYGLEHAGWTSKTAVKRFQRDMSNKLTKDQSWEVIQDVNSQLALMLDMERTRLKSGQVVFRSKKTGRFGSLRTPQQEAVYQRFRRLSHFSPEEYEEAETLKAKARGQKTWKIPEDEWRKAQQKE